MRARARAHAHSISFKITGGIHETSLYLRFYELPNPKIIKSLNKYNLCVLLYRCKIRPIIDRPLISYEEFLHKPESSFLNSIASPDLKYNDTDDL